MRSSFRLEARLFFTTPGRRSQASGAFERPEFHTACRSRDLGRRACACRLTCGFCTVSTYLPEVSLRLLLSVCHPVYPTLTPPEQSPASHSAHHRLRTPPASHAAHHRLRTLHRVSPPPRSCKRHERRSRMHRLLLTETRAWRRLSMVPPRFNAVRANPSPLPPIPATNA